MNRSTDRLNPQPDYLGELELTFLSRRTFKVSALLIQGCSQDRPESIDSSRESYLEIQYEADDGS